MKVVCVEASKSAIRSGSVKIGKEYEVIKELDKMYIIKDDRGVKPSVSKEKFKPVCSDQQLPV